MKSTYLVLGIMKPWSPIHHFKMTGSSKHGWKRLYTRGRTSSAPHPDFVSPLSNCVISNK